MINSNKGSVLIEGKESQVKAELMYLICEIIDKGIFTVQELIRDIKLFNKED